MSQRRRVHYFSHRLVFPLWPRRAAPLPVLSSHHLHSAPWPWLLLLALVLHSARRTGHRQAREDWGTGRCWPRPVGAAAGPGPRRRGRFRKAGPPPRPLQFLERARPWWPVTCSSRGNLNREGKAAWGAGERRARAPCGAGTPPHILPGLSRSARELPRRVPFATLFLKLVSTRFSFFLLKSLNGRKLGTRPGEEGALSGGGRPVAGASGSGFQPESLRRSV